MIFIVIIFLAPTPCIHCEGEIEGYFTFMKTSQKFILIKNDKDVKRRNSPHQEIPHDFK